MLTIYHLEQSRSGRIIWLAEELGLDYKVESFKRGPQMQPPPEFKALGPFARAPMIRDGDLTVIESGAIIEYLLTRHGQGRLVPAQNSPEFVQYLQWLHFSEGSLMADFINVYFLDTAGLKDNPLRQATFGRFADDIGYVESVLAQRPFLAGQHFTGADIAMTMGLTAAGQFAKDGLSPHPHIDAYLAKLTERPAYKKAQSFG